MSGRSARRHDEHVVAALRADERRVAVVVDREPGRAVGRVREPRPGRVARRGQRRRRLARVVDAVDLRASGRRRSRRTGRCASCRSAASPERTRSGARFDWKIGVQVPSGAARSRAKQAARGAAGDRRVDRARVARIELDLVDEPRAGARSRTTRRRRSTPRRRGPAMRRTVRGAVEFEASPCVPERVPIRMWLALPGSIAIHVIERLFASGVEPGTRLQLLPSSVDLKRPRPASLSPLPFASPVPTYSVLPVGSFGSTAIEPIAFVGMSAGDLLPVRVLRERVLRPPDAAAGGADVQRALVLVALRADGHRGDAAGPLRRLDEGLRAEPVDVERVGPDLIPLETSFGPFLWSFALALIAPWISAGVISEAGYARSVYSSAAAPSAPSAPFAAALEDRLVHQPGCAELLRDRRAVGRCLCH